MSERTERERLIQFMTERKLDHKELARTMKWSPTYIYGYLGGAWSLTDSFRWTFAKTFGFDAAGRVFVPENGHSAPPTINNAPAELSLTA